MGPNIESLSTTINKIYESKEKIIDGEPDWYGVLGLKKPATLEKICDEYIKLRRVVEKGRNEAVGAEGALQILSEACCKLTQTFWTRCSCCRFQFQYSNARINKQLVCKNCRHLFIAVPLDFGNHPLNQNTMSSFSPMYKEDSLVLALSAKSPEHQVEPSEPEIKEMLMNKARTEISKHLYE